VARHRHVDWQSTTATASNEPDLVGGPWNDPCKGWKGPIERQEQLPALEALLWHPTGIQPCRPATARQRSDTEAGEARRRSRPLRSAGRLHLCRKRAVILAAGRRRGVGGAAGCGPIPILPLCRLTNLPGRRRKRYRSRRRIRCCSALLAGIFDPMVSRSPRPDTPDLFAKQSDREHSSPSSRPAKRGPTRDPAIAAPPVSRHILPQDLPGAIKQITDQELERLVEVAFAEQRRRFGKPSVRHAPSASTFFLPSFIVVLSLETSPYAFRRSAHQGCLGLICLFSYRQPHF
jgi:hypothetical protein